MAENKFKSLQESLLKFIVINSNEVLDILEEPRIVKPKLLPPYLFEKILHKSKAMRWDIRVDILIKALTYRDVLRWKNVDLIEWMLPNDVLMKMSQIAYPITTLAIFVSNISDEVTESLCRMGSSIESLDIKYYRRTTSNIVTASYVNLQKLRLTRHYSFDHEDTPINLEFRLFSNSLKELMLENDHLDANSIKSLSCLRQLNVLSISFASLTCQDHNFLEALSSMDKLRTLDLKGSLGSASGKFLSKLIDVISKLPNLENIDISYNSDIGKDWVLRFLKCKYWKKFGMYFHHEFMNDYSVYDNFKPWADEILGMYEESVLSTCESYLQYYERDDDIFESILSFVPRIPSDQLPRAENVLLKFLNVDRPGFCRYIWSYLDTGRCTRSFIEKLLNMICSYCLLVKLKDCAIIFRDCGIIYILDNVYVVPVMVEIVQKKLNRGLKKMLLHSIYTASYYSLRKEIQEIGAQRVCRRALKNELIDEEVLEAMKKLIVKMSENLWH